MEHSENSCNQSGPAVPFERVERFVRRLTHEIRNQFGALDLEAAYIAQAAADPVTSAEVAKLRRIVTEATLQLKRLSAALGPIEARKIRCGAKMFINEL